MTERGGEEVGPELMALLRLSAALAVGSRSQWRNALHTATTTVGQATTEEVILQSYLFVGFPVVLNALSAQREQAPTAPPGVPDPDLAGRRTAGEDLCRKIYGSAYDRLREHVASLHPDLDRWMIEEGYGKTLSRPGPGALDRELCVVSLLAAGGHIPQLRSHLRGSLNLGATPEQVEVAVEVGLDTVDAMSPRRADPDLVRNAWRDVLSRVGAG